MLECVLRTLVKACSASLLERAAAAGSVGEAGDTSEEDRAWFPRTERLVDLRRPRGLPGTRVAASGCLASSLTVWWKTLQSCVSRVHD